VAGVGLVPAAPGTAGAAFAAAIFVLLSLLPGTLGAAALALAGAAAFGAGIWAAQALEAATGREDDGRIVIDEVVGQWLTLAPLLALPGWRFGLDAAGLAPVVTGFVAFRVLDVWKPGPVRWLQDNLRGGAGVVMDDVLAGVFGAVGMAVALQVIG